MVKRNMGSDLSADGKEGDRGTGRNCSFKR